MSSGPTLSPLYFAVKDGNEAAVISLVEQKAWISDQCFLAAVLRPNANILRCLLARVPSKIPLRNKQGKSLLQLAIQNRLEDNALCVLQMARESHKNIWFQLNEKRECVEFQDAIANKWIRVANEIRESIARTNARHWGATFQSIAREAILDIIPLDSPCHPVVHNILVTILKEESSFTHIFLWNKFFRLSDFSALFYLIRECNLSLNFDRCLDLYRKCPPEILTEILGWLKSSVFRCDGNQLFHPFNEENLRVLVKFSSRIDISYDAIPWNHIILHKAIYVLSTLFRLTPCEYIESRFDIFYSEQHMETVGEVMKDHCLLFPWSRIVKCSDTLVKFYVSHHCHVYVDDHEWDFEKVKSSSRTEMLLQLYCRDKNDGIVGVLRKVLKTKPSREMLQNILNWLDDPHYRRSNAMVSVFSRLDITPEVFPYLKQLLDFHPTSPQMNQVWDTKSTINVNAKNLGSNIIALGTMLRNRNINFQVDIPPSWDNVQPEPPQWALKKWGKTWVRTLDLQRLEWLLKAHRCDPFLNFDDHYLIADWPPHQYDYNASLWTKRDIQHLTLLIRYQAVSTDELIDILDKEDDECGASIIRNATQCALDGWTIRWIQVMSSLNAFLLQDITQIVLSYTEQFEQMSAVSIYHDVIEKKLKKIWGDYSKNWTSVDVHIEDF